ncbi:hypothetical protein CB1_001892002 [Camelus ferus]|nr:hypothetical protein CB1_001892002 [Camelus ferus]
MWISVPFQKPFFGLALRGMTDFSEPCSHHVLGPYGTHNGTSTACLTVIAVTVRTLSCSESKFDIILNRQVPEERSAPPPRQNKYRSIHSRIVLTPCAVAKEIKHLLLLNPAVWDVGTTTPAQPAGARRAIFTESQGAVAAPELRAGWLLGQQLLQWPFLWYEVSPTSPTFPQCLLMF